MEFKQDDSCSVQKSSCFLEIPFFKLSLTKGTLYRYWCLFLYYKIYMLYIICNSMIILSNRCIPSSSKDISLVK